MQRYRWFTIFVAIGLILGWTSVDTPSSVYADTPLLRIVAPSTPQSTTDPVQVWLEIDDAVDLAGWEFDLEYDHSLATLTTITLTNLTGETGTCDPNTARCALPLGPQELNNATAVGSYSYGTGGSGNDDGVLATFTFQPTGKTGQTLLHIANPRLADTAGASMVPSTQDAFLQFGVPTGVTLASFTVEPRPTDLLVLWETASELNTLGFNLYRSTTPADLGTRLNLELIPSQSPGGGQGADYDWTDSDVIPHTTYYYWLEDVDMQGNPTLHGPVSGTLGAPTAVDATDFQVKGVEQPSLIQIVAGVILLALTLLVARWGWLHSTRRIRTLFFIVAVLPLLVFLFVPSTNAAPFAPTIPSSSTGNEGRVELYKGNSAEFMTRPYDQLSTVCFSRDLTCDHAVDETDLSLESQHWHCATGDACYEARYDFDANGKVTVVDLQLLASDYDRDAPEITVNNPTDSAVLAPPSVTVTGIVSDRHAIVSVMVNGVAASLTGDDFSANVPLQGGNQTFAVIAEDELGATSTEMLVVKVDSAGPLVTVLSPAHRQSVYTIQPYVEIRYSDFLSSVELNSLQVTLTQEGGSPTDITSQLTVEPNQAYGYVADLLTTDSVYTLTVSLADTLGNTTVTHSTFYIPADPYSIPHPSVEEGSGWLTGVVYDSSTCDEFLKECHPLKGVTVTAEILDPEERDTNNLYGAVISGPDGFFAFPFVDTGTYALRFEKEGFTYGQREVNVARGHSTAANAIYLTPFDTAVTPCDSSGCTHESADGQMRVIVPAGAIPEGQSLDVTATLFDRVNFLPGGELPPGTQETYAFNLSGESDFEFTKPVTVQVQNYRDFDPGTLIPLGVWNPDTLQWDHAGTGKVDPTGEWVMIEVMHFSMYDCNDPMVPADAGGDLAGETEEEEKCTIGSPGCLIHTKSGVVQEWIDDMPVVNVLDQPVGPVLRYSTARANPSAVIDIKFSINPDPTQIEFFDPYVNYELYIEGERTDEFTTAVDFDQPGEVGRYRYLWDGRNAFGEQLPSGVYDYGVKVTFSYFGEYCYAMGGIFGNTPDCEFGRTGNFAYATASEWFTGTVELNSQGDSPFGAGWTLEGQQKLFRDDSGHLLIADGEELAEYYTELGDELRGRGYYNVPQPPVSAPASVLPLVPAPAGGTFVSTDITTDTTWTLAGSPYKVVGDDVTVDDNVTLTIEPGVKVLVEEGRELRVEGIVQAVGTATQPITMSIYVEPIVDTFEPVPGALYGTSAVSIDSDGNVWYAGTEFSYSNGIELRRMAPDGTQEEIIIPPEIQPGYQVYDLVHDANDNLYLATSEGAGYYDTTTETWTLYRTDTSPIPSNFVQGIAVAANAVWFGTNLGVAHLDLNSGTWTPYTTTHGLPSDNVLAVAIASDGSTWFGTDTGLAVRSTGGTWTTYDTGNSPILGNYVNEIAFDAEGDGWLAIQDEGISILSATATWSDYTPANSGLGSAYISSFLLVGDDYQWIGHPFSGVSYLKANGTIWYHQDSPPLPGYEVRDIALAPNGDLWLAQYNTDTLTRFRRLPLTTPTTSGGWWDFEIGGGSIEEDSNSSHLSYVTIEGAGLDNPGALYLNRSAPTMDNLTIHASGSNGLHGLDSPPITLQTAWIESNDGDGVHLEGDIIIGTLVPNDGSHLISDVVVQDNNGDGVYLDDGTPLELVNSIVTRNDGYGVFTGFNSGGGDAFDSNDDDALAPIRDLAPISNEGASQFIPNDVTAFTITDSDIQDNGVAARLAPNSVLNGVDWSGNRRNELEWIGGAVDESRTWGPLQGGINTYRVVGGILFEDGTTLTITPGTAVLFEGGGSLSIHGVLSAIGNKENVVYFGPAEDNDWSLVQVGGGSLNDSNASQLRYVVFERGQFALREATPALLDYITVRDSSFYGMSLVDSLNVVLTNCNFVGNGQYAIYNATPQHPMTATNCFWGDASGPFHPFDHPEGLGQPISDGVLFDPFSPFAIVMERFRPVVRNNTTPDQSTVRYSPETDTYTRTYPDGREVHFSAEGQHLFTRRPDGRETRYSYNPDGTLASMAMVALGHIDPHWIWTFAYTDGKLSSITDPAGRITNFTIDANGQLTEVELPDASTRRFFYDERDLLTQQEDRTGDITTYVYDNFGRLTTHISPPRPVTDPVTGESTVEQEVRTYEPSDTTGLLNGTMVGDPDNPAPTPPQSDELVDTITLERGEISGHTNEFGSWLDNTDALGRTIQYEYDSENNLTRIVEPDGDCAEFSYDGNGNLLTEQKMGTAQCHLTPPDRDPAQIQTWIQTYEPHFNNLKMETDPLGRTTTYIYDYELGMGDAGKLVRIELPPVRDGTETIVTPVIQYTYNNLGLRETKTDARGTVTKYVYTQGIPAEAADGATPYFRPGVTPIPGILVQRIDDFGNATHENLMTAFTELDAAGNPGMVTGPDGHQTTTYVYDSLDRVISETDAVGIVTTYAYDEQGNLIEVIEDYTADGTTGRNVYTRYIYDAEGRLLTEQTIDGTLTVQTTTGYDKNGMLASYADGLGHTTFFTYDAADQLITEQDAAGEIISHTYTADGYKSTTTDEDGYVHHWLYDGLGRMVQTIEDEGGLNLTTLYSYNLANNLLSMTDATGTVTCYGYDSHNRVITETNDCGDMNLVTENKYDLGGNLLSNMGWNGVVNRYTYDALGRPTLTRWDDGGFALEMTRLYDDAGNLVESTDPRGTVSRYVYDDLDRLIERCRDDGGLNQCTTFSYDRLGNPTTMTDPAGRLYQNRYNAFGLLTEQHSDEGDIDSITRIEYDNALNPISVTDPNGTVTTNSYSPRDEIILESFADGTTNDYTYDGRGNLTLYTQQDGTTITETYDGASRQTARTFSTGGSQSFIYDNMGRLTTAGQTMDGNVTLITNAYNPLGDLLTETQSLNGEAYTVGYTYDYLNDYYTVAYPSGATRSYTLDALGRTSEIADETSAVIASYGFDIPNGISTVTYGNAVATEITYDPLYRTTEVSSPLAEYRYGYDIVDNVTFMQRGHQPDQPADVYQYDGLDRVTQVWYGADATEPEDITAQEHLQEYELDTAGNRLAVRNDGDTDLYGPSDGAHLTDPMHRYQLVAGIPFTYDDRGNLLDDGNNSYEYDILNRQTGMDGAVSADYLYDALGRRVAKLVTNGGTTTTRYLYDKHFQVLEERDGAGALVTRYSYGAGIDEPLTMERGGATYYYHRDALGNVTEMSSDTETLVERYEYDVYGKVTIYDASDTPLVESAIGNPYLFTGRRLDGESGNYEYRNRMYSPYLGRFMQTDPLGTADSMTRYTYARGNPTTFVDPMGLKGTKGGSKTIQPVPRFVDLPDVLNYTGPSQSAESDAFTRPKFTVFDEFGPDKKTVTNRGADPIIGQRYSTYKGKSCCERDIDSVELVITTQIFFKAGVNPEGTSGYGRGTTREDVNNGNTTLRFHEEQHRQDVKDYVNSNPPPPYVLPTTKAPSGRYTCEDVDRATSAWKQALLPYYRAMTDYTYKHTDCAGTEKSDCYANRLAEEFKPPVPIKLPPKPKGKGKGKK